MTGRENATGTQTLTLRQAQGRLFDAENRLSQVEGTGGGYSGTATYVYDGDGNRIKKTEGGSTVVYPNKYYEKNVTSDVVTSHYYLGGQQVAIKKGSTLEYIHQDSLNSSSLSTDSSGSQVSKTVFLPFGATRSSTGTLGTDQLYTGQRLDGTGLYFYNARYYDPEIGRFISPDTIVEDISNPQTLNRYSYVYNNPLTFNDPTGHGIGNWMKGVLKGFAGAAWDAAKSLQVMFFATPEQHKQLQQQMIYVLNTPGSGGALFKAIAAKYDVTTPEGLGYTLGTLAVLITLGKILPSEAKAEQLISTNSRAGVLKAADDLPGAVSNSAKSFFKEAKNSNGEGFSVVRNADGTYTMVRYEGGNNPGAYAVYYRVVDADGNYVAGGQVGIDPQNPIPHDHPYP